MPSAAADPNIRGTWIVQGDAVALEKMLQDVANDSGVQVLQRIAKDVVLLAMTAIRAAALRRQFAGALIIEPDQQMKSVDPMKPIN